MAKNQVVLYTDGACEGNPGPGGIGAVIFEKGTRRELSRGFRLTTNNRMEILAIVAGLESLEGPSEVKIFSDSKYVVDGMTQGWVGNWEASDWVRKGGRRVPNADLWKRLLTLVKKHEISFEWVKGHAGDTNNERADKLSYAAIEGSDLLEDEGYLRQIELEQLRPSKISQVGQPCRKCGTPVVKKVPKRKPKADQAYYFEYYLQCPECQTMYMVDAAKRSIEQKTFFED